MSNAAVAKIFSVSEKRGGSGGGSFRPFSRSSLDVAPAAEDASVALIGGGAGVGRVVLSVLVLVRLGLESGRVEPELERGVPRPANGQGLRDLARLLVPGLEHVRAG